jgi:hypothetical protein
MILVAAIMVEEIAQVAVAAVVAVVAVAAVVVATVVVVVATVVVVAEAEMVAVVAIVAVNEMVAVTAAEVAVTDQTIRKGVVARITKENHVTPIHDQTEVIVQKGKKSHSKDDQRSAAEVTEAVELAIVE